MGNIVGVDFGEFICWNSCRIFVVVIVLCVVCSYVIFVGVCRGLLWCNVVVV